MDYLIVKWLHILSSTVLFGTGVGSAFFMFMANRRRETAGIYFAARHVVMADWIFTTPAVVFQLASGLYLMHLDGYDFSSKWIISALALYAFTGCCWIPVVWMQIRMRNMAALAARNGTDLPARYWSYDRWWILLGALAFPAVIAIFWLMVVKPV